jgi:hypothetical protein
MEVGLQADSPPAADWRRLGLKNKMGKHATLPKLVVSEEVFGSAVFFSLL